MTPATRRALASAAIFFVMGFLGRREPAEQPFVFTLSPDSGHEFEEAVMTVMGLRALILNDPDIVKDDGGSACFSH